jgi:hypothetical protein
LNLSSDILVSKFAFKFNLRHYSLVSGSGGGTELLYTRMTGKGLH